MIRREKGLQRQSDNFLLLSGKMGVFRMLKIILCNDDQFILQLGAEKINDIIKLQKLDAKVVSMALGSNGVLLLKYP